MRFALLGSGSRGNSTLVESGSCRVMIDCGFSLRETKRRLERLNVKPESISAILVTHEHSDHSAGIHRIAAAFRIPVFLTAGTHRAVAERFAKRSRLAKAVEITAGEIVDLGGLEITAVPVPHDASEPVQFVMSDGNRRLGVLTDTGHVTDALVAMYSGLSAFVLESNHDTDMLRRGPYPPQLQDRIAGNTGHLSNDQAAGLLSTCNTDHLSHIVAAHLSEKNNTPELARRALSTALGCKPQDIAVADQQYGLDWREIS
ncbi:MAG: MBL fold metallo-hydrolase [Gammaproteobacteria bacterium]